MINNSGVEMKLRDAEVISEVRSHYSNLIAEQILYDCPFREFIEDALVEGEESLCQEIARRVRDGEYLTLYAALDNGDCAVFELSSQPKKEFDERLSADLDRWRELYLFSESVVSRKIAKRKMEAIQYYLELSKHQEAFKMLKMGFLYLDVEDYFVEQRLGVWDEAANFMSCNFVPILAPEDLTVKPGVMLKDQLNQWVNVLRDDAIRRITENEREARKKAAQKDIEEVSKRFCVTTNTPKRKPKPRKLERDLEAELLYWLDQRGVMAEQQVSSRGKRTDVWIPGKCFLELKRGRVTGDDVCQAAKYFTLYSRQIILVGETMSPRAGEGISAINAVAKEDALAFVTWSGVKTYLEARLA